MTDPVIVNVPAPSGPTTVIVDAPASSPPPPLPLLPAPSPVGVTVVPTYGEQGPPGAPGAAGQNGVNGQNGAAGPQGPAGAITAITFTQSVPALTWTISHGLPHRPVVRTFTNDGDEIEADVSFPNTTTVVVSWYSPATGSAELI